MQDDLNLRISHRLKDPFSLYEVHISRVIRKRLRALGDEAIPKIWKVGTIRPEQFPL